MNGIKINLYSLSSYSDDDAITLVFEIQNNTDETVRILKWYTPLEGFYSNCLSVTVGGKKVPYDGISVKRSDPSTEDFISLEAGAAVSARINVEEAYSLPLKSTVKVEFDPTRLTVAPVNTDQASNRQKQKRKAKIVVTNCKFISRRRRKGTKTKGEQMRAEEKRVKAKAAPLGTLKAAIYDNMDDNEKATMKGAHEGGYKLTTDALAALANDASYKTWFGAHTTARFAKVKGVYTKIKEAMETKTFTYSNDGPECASHSTWIAYTTRGTEKIFLCTAFWALSGPPDSKSGTVVHEHSHATASTDDHKYGVKACKDLAKNSPDDAVENADNFEYYAEKVS